VGVSSVLIVGSEDVLDLTAAIIDEINKITRTATTAIFIC